MTQKYTNRDGSPEEQPYEFKFGTTERYLWRRGDIFLGAGRILRNRVGIPLERHALTFAGTGSGKGACQIIPNIALWEENLLVIDPKGETISKTAQIRESRYGQDVFVIDPFEYADDAGAYRAQFNPLSLVRGTEDLFDLADGIVMRTGKESDPHWIESALDALARILAYIIAAPEHEIPSSKKTSVQSFPFLMISRTPYKSMSCWTSSHRLTHLTDLLAVPHLAFVATLEK